MALREISKIFEDIGGSSREPQTDYGILCPQLLLSMNAKDIAVFKRFLKSHGVNTMFVGLYNQYRYEDNAKNVQEYLATVPRNLVIAYAFDLSKLTKSSFGAKYWNDLDQKWRNYINVTDDRKSFELPIQEEKAAKRDELANAESERVNNDWCGLDLLDINAKASRKLPMPDENEVRINTKKKNVVVLNSVLVHVLDGAGFDTMDIRVDRNTNRMVLVFGNDLKFNVGKYSTDVKCVQHKAVIEYLGKYLAVLFDPEKHYYVKIAQRMWNNAHTEYAVVLSQRFTVK